MVRLRRSTSLNRHIGPFSLATGSGRSCCSLTLSLAWPSCPRSEPNGKDQSDGPLSGIEDCSFGLPRISPVRPPVYRRVRRPIQDNTYLVGDALERMKALPDGFCPTIVTSPPYNVGDDMTPLRYRNWQRRIIAEGCRVAGREGLFAYRQQPLLRGRTRYRFSDIVGHPLPYGWTLRSEIIWCKGNGDTQGDKYLTGLPATTEHVFLFAGPMWHVPAEATSDARHWGSVFYVNREDLALRCVRLGRERVLDPFAGSGSTLLAAHRLRRPYLGIDLSPEYRALFNERLSAESTGG